ncbi:hypothetical protein UAJ10_02230 [Nitrospirillum sp. BR 11164]|uniref:hypothetical protein n=1 Tax=Nitrospirillum sp. BR 11164 TaxID=3104324 RepID=UPI002AFE1D83|nr:hypothetical protein [Nitrospirillum sp. BR 11164]MEA1647837.1 hypothetical protein [Nitrospirillum sp. BR 11164]
MDEEAGDRERRGGDAVTAAHQGPVNDALGINSSNYDTVVTIYSELVRDLPLDRRPILPLGNKMKNRRITPKTWAIAAATCTVAVAACSSLPLSRTPSLQMVSEDNWTANDPVRPLKFKVVEQGQRAEWLKSARRATVLPVIIRNDPGNQRVCFCVTSVDGVAVHSLDHCPNRTPRQPTPISMQVGERLNVTVWRPAPDFTYKMQADETCARLPLAN